MSYSIVCSLWGYSHVDWCCLESKGASGGNLLICNRRVVEKIEECVGGFIVACSLRNVENQFSCALFFDK